MPLRHQIELGMTLALFLYLGAFKMARTRWRTHLALAGLGFLTDMYATALMIRLREEDTHSFWSLPWKIQVHTSFAIIAILVFVGVATMGLEAHGAKERGESAHYSHYRAWHVWGVKYLFLPVWILAYSSGFLLAF
ncbi:MAG: hypothetical protein JWN89_691 [Parcubacteria group bacterium]|nr:hypothetical protein [Parcubacteria group bacterium]